MPIANLARRPRELGRIRIGQRVTGQDGKTRPAKLDRFRVTSASRLLLDQVAGLYGGEVHVWQPPSGPQQFEVVTAAARIPVLVPPQPVSQWLETWSAGGCVHRCDGVTEVISGLPCDGGPEHIEAKPTTRLNVILRDVAAVGVFRLESHGWNAAAELPDMAAFLAQAGGYVDGWLALEERVSKAGGQTRRFIVPTIEVDITPAELLAGGRARTEIEAPGRQAIEAAPAYVVDTATGEITAAPWSEEDPLVAARVRVSQVANILQPNLSEDELNGWVRSELQQRNLDSSSAGDLHTLAEAWEQS